MPYYDLYASSTLLSGATVAHNAGTVVLDEFSVADYDELYVVYDVTVGFTGGTSPGLKFTLEFKMGSDWVAASTVLTSDNGFTAAPADPTVTTTGKAFRRYAQLPCTRARIKYQVTGSPTGGSATINSIYFVAKRG